MATIELDLSIITALTGRPHAVKTLLKSIWETADPVAFEIWLIRRDDKNLPLTITDDFPDLKIEKAEESTAKTINRLIAVAAGRYTLLIDPDVTVKADCLKILVNFMDDNPDVGIAGPLVLNAYDKAEATAHFFPSFLNLLAQTIIGHFLPNSLKKSKSLHLGNKSQSPIETDWLGGGLRIMRRELLDDIKLPEVHFGRGLPEAFFCLLAKKRGWHIFIVPQAQVLHPNPLRYNPELSTDSVNKASLLEVLSFLKNRWFS